MRSATETTTTTTAIPPAPCPEPDPMHHQVHSLHRVHRHRRYPSRQSNSSTGSFSSVFSNSSLFGTRSRRSTASGSSASRFATDAAAIAALRLKQLRETLMAVPGLRPSAAFFYCLRDNLTLSDPSSPYLSATTMSSEATSSALTATDAHDVAPANAADANDEPKPLVTYVATTMDDKIAGLKRVADSVAQQRQIASKSLIFHPLIMALYVAVMGFLVNRYLIQRTDPGYFLTTGGSITMCVLTAVRLATGAYLQHAEDIRLDFLDSPDGGEQDRVIVSKYGDEVMAALVLRLERAGGSGRKRKSGGQALIRGWTVRIRYRGAGVGTALLEEAVRVAREKLGKDAEIGFAADHVNHHRVLPALFNGYMDKGEQRAAKALARVVDEHDGRRRK